MIDGIVINDVGAAVEPTIVRGGSTERSRWSRVVGKFSNFGGVWDVTAFTEARFYGA